MMGSTSHSWRSCLYSFSTGGCRWSHDPVIVDYESRLCYDPCSDSDIAHTRFAGARRRHVPHVLWGVRGGDCIMWHMRKGAYGGHTHSTLGDAADLPGC